MEISYTAPLRRAWQRMRAMLFRPFHLERWLVIGFAAFLANLFGHGGGLFSWKNAFRSHHHIPSPGAERAVQAMHDAVMRVLEQPLVLLALAVGLVVFGVMLLVLGWASARARFVFLDNVVTGRGEFVEPWNRYGRLGRSLFLWYAAFSFAFLLPIGVAALPFLHVLGSAMRGEEFAWPALGAMVFGIGFAIVMCMLLGFVEFMVRQFVVPLMMMYDEGALTAWRRFWPLFKSRPGDFIAYALFVAVVWIGVVIGLGVAGVATCCIGLALMLIPYVGTVVLLPVEITARAYGPEFLAQFGPEWDLFAARAPKSAAPPASEPGGPLPG